MSRPTFEELDDDETVENTEENSNAHYENTGGRTSTTNSERQRNSNSSGNGNRRRPRNRQRNNNSFFGTGTRNRFFSPRFGIGSLFGDSFGGGDSFFDDEDGFVGGGFGGGFGSLMSGFDDFSNSSDNSNTKFYSSCTSSTSINGVTQTTKREQDHTGREKMKVERKIGNQKITVEKDRESDGTERTTKNVEGLNPGEFDEFDRTFNQYGGAFIPPRLQQQQRNRSNEEPLRNIKYKKHSKKK